MKTKVKMLAAGLVLGLFSGGAHAAATYCNTGLLDDNPLTNAAGLSVTDVTYSNNYPLGPFTNANDCYGVVAGNDQGNGEGSGVVPTLWDGGWASVVTDQANGGNTSGSFGGYTFTLAAAGLTTGTWTLSVTGSPLPEYFDLVVVLKPGPQFAAYYFNDLLLDGSGGGAFTITFTHPRNDSVNDLSHMSLWARDGDTPANGRIPEPGMLGLLGVGLLGQAWLFRRRRQQQK